MGAEAGGETQTDPTKWAAGGTLGCLGCSLFLVLLFGTFVVAALGWIFWPLVLLCKIGLLSCDANSGGGVDNDKVVAAYNSDGRGALNEATVPSEYLAYVKEAGAQCPQIGPIVIAAQIQQESGFNASLVGPDGAKGISQMPPDKFTEFGEDDDDSGETSALNAEDSIMAQARYMCALAKDIDRLADNNEIRGDRLNMTLAAYELGLDAVKQAKGVPKGDTRTGSYVVGVRSGFAMYSADGGLPGATSPPSLSPRPTPSS
ncbi:transglycosylase SLT domain-containing protein [Streptomyces sp. NPDC059850]|uniref:transglycosylase SLT domain-containing protein n=1 Tax=Streptomyces sp. NPDC059850 TaxID=3346970 RepID=UPI00364646B9